MEPALHFTGLVVIWGSLAFFWLVALAIVCAAIRGFIEAILDRTQPDPKHGDKG